MTATFEPTVRYEVGVLVSKDLHKKVFFAVFGLKLDLEAASGDLTRVLPVLQVLLVLVLALR